jgi:hypothetical protein
MAQNTHRYEDAHSELYRYLIDGLDRDCLKAMAAHQSKAVNVESSRTVTSLKSLLPSLDPAGPLNRTFDLVSSQRGLADHHVRPAAAPFRAFEAFTEDLQLALDGIKELICVLETEFGVDSKRAARRWEAMTHMPRIARPAEPGYSICQADAMVGKTIERVEYGFRQDIEGVNQSELLILHFTDGSVACVDTCCNAGQLFGEQGGFAHSDVHVDFRIEWVPSLRP